MRVVIYQRIARALVIEVEDGDAARQWLDEWMVKGCPHDEPGLRLLKEEVEVGPDPGDPWKRLKERESERVKLPRRVGAAGMERTE